MVITKITQQLKRADRYSIFVDGKYSFSLSESALLESQLASGRELTKEQIEDYQQQSADDKVYSQALRWAALRLRGEGETRDYLKRKGSPALQVEQITNKLKVLGLANDKKLAEAYVHDSQLFRPTSVRKMIAKLKQKRIPEQVIQIALNEIDYDEQSALCEVIAKKRRQSKYKDDQKLMQYLARQGFNYSDIKEVLAKKTI